VGKIGAIAGDDGAGLPVPTGTGRANSDDVADPSWFAPIEPMVVGSADRALRDPVAVETALLGFWPGTGASTAASR
jgi:hypothetical protein